MKKLFLLAGMMMIFILPAPSQLTVSKSGQSIFGKRMYQNLPGFPTLASVEKEISVSRPLVPVDTLASAVFLGRSTDNAGGYITFGSNKNVWIGEGMSSNSAWWDMMHLGFVNGIKASTRNGILFQYVSTPNSGNRPLQIYTDVSANSFVVSSDSRLKSNVKTLSQSAGLLSDLNPVSYTLVSQSAMREKNDIKSADILTEVEGTDTDVNDKSPIAPDSRIRYGFLAQEVKELFPALVIENGDGTLGIDYIGFIPLLVDAIRDLESRVREQEDEIAVLGGSDAIRKKSAATVRERLLAEGCVLEQNSPNPFSATTTIGCTLPETVSEATIFIYDLQGQQLLRRELSERGSTGVIIEASSLAPGMYIYSLIADGAEIDSKRMIVTD